MTNTEKDSIILGIESSCDDTGVAIAKEGKILANVIANQEVHRIYGGVIPELASRAHMANIVPTMEKALADAEIDKSELTRIHYTESPGLMGSLLVGIQFAKGLSMALGIPAIGMNHMDGHIYSLFLSERKPEFPLLCLTVSGGHTQLSWVENKSSIVVIGKTLDDAAGEAFDKAGKVMGLPYPAGPVIDRLAKRGTAKFVFPKTRVDELDFSYSGLKSAFMRVVQQGNKKNPAFVEENLADLCASIQEAIVLQLLTKMRSALKERNPMSLGVVGGVSANSALRAAMTALSEEVAVPIYFPERGYSTDNAAMLLGV